MARSAKGACYPRDCACSISWAPPRISSETVAAVIADLGLGEDRTKLAAEQLVQVSSSNS